MENSRPPVVTVVGHVDHGKTSLLDAIRKTSITKREAGGITQSIGASIATTKEGKNITFIDTPGHALFSSMRSRGVNLADIAILVVAADDGVQPQTKEAIKLLQASGTAFVVAITKVDLGTANMENSLQSLEKEGVYLEKRGGDVPFVGVSSKTGEGINELLELIALVWEVKDVKADPSDKLEGFVIETVKDKRGLLVSVIVKNGKIKIGDTVFAGQIQAKVKGIFDSEQKPIKEILPGFPGQILGFEELPMTGSQIASMSIAPQSQNNSHKTQENSDSKIKIFVKAKTTGSLEALLASIPDEVQVVGSGVGDLTPNDIFIAKAANAQVFMFEAKFANQIKRLAETESVKIEKFDVIYELLDRLTELLKVGEEKITGEAQILAIFPYEGKKVAGSKVSRGKITKGDSAKLMRQEKEVGKVKIISIRKQKDEVNMVAQGEECGILFAPQLDFAIGDVLLSVTK